MLIFLLATLTTIALSFVIWPLKKAPKTQKLIKSPPSEENLRLYQEQYQELQQERDAGRLNEEVFLAAEQELTERLSQDAPDAVNATQTQAKVPPHAPLKSGYFVIIIALFLGITVGVYYAISHPDAFKNLFTHNQTTDAKPAPELPADHPNVTESDIEKMVSNLAERLESEPDNREGWIMLGRSYRVLGRYTDATQAYERANRLSTEDDAELLADFAETLAFANNGKLNGEARALLQRALKANPAHPKALWYSGISAFEQAEYRQAISHWQTLQKHAPPDTVNDVLNDNIARARELAGIAVETPPSTPESAPEPAPQPESKPAPKPDLKPASTETGVLTISVALKPALLENVKPDQALFIFVKADDGQPMPLAVTRRLAKELPLTIKLSDANAMLPSRKLSDFENYQVGARISQSGTATPSPGDLVGSATAARGQTTPVEILIDTTVE